MNKTAFIYPGQGVQKAGMGLDFYENSPQASLIYDRAGEALEIDMKELCFRENDKLDLTEYTQAALVTTCLAMTRALEAEAAKRGIEDFTPAATAGLSLGEYCAIAAAGGMEDIDAIRLVRKRGILMQNTVPEGEGAMAAVMGMTGEEIEQVIEQIEGASVANYNCPGQIVITGKKASVEKAGDKLKEAGAKRVVPLNVSGPFHSAMLQPAGKKLAEELAEVELHPLKTPYITNVTAQKITDINETKPLLAKQVSMPVRWQQSMETLIADGIDTFIEIGPGRTLNGFLRKIDKTIPVHNIATWADIDTVLEKLMQ